MAELPPASLVNLPVELLREIFPSPYNSSNLPLWPMQPRSALTMKSSWIDVPWLDLEQKAICAASLTMRALSQTCSRLRAYALPTLWETIEIQGSDDLIRLRDTFRAWPFLATYVRSIIFSIDLHDYHDMRDSMVEVIDQMRSLEMFSWSVSQYNMPAEVCQALIRLTGLRRLHVQSLDERTFEMLPLWQVSHSLEELSLSLSETVSFLNLEDSGDEVHSEETFTSFEFPVMSPAIVQQITSLYINTIARTVITAAQSGRLKSLFTNAEAPFAIPSMLPYWVNIVNLGERCYSHDWYSRQRSGSWRLAASQLRPLLAHHSRWQATSPASLRLLTRQDVQSLHSSDFFEDSVPDSDGEDDGLQQLQPIQAQVLRGTDQYLDWLKNDEELAQRVADAWNAVVERGDASLGECECPRCKPEDTE